MADFTPDIQAPASAWQIGRGAEAPKSVIGELASTLTPVIEKGMGMWREQKKQNLLGEEDAALSQVVQDYANPGLVGQSTNPADADPTVQAGKTELNKIGTSVAQGRMSREEALTRAATTTSRLVSENPYYAEDLRKHAQEVLGFNSNAALFDEASRTEKFKTELAQGATTMMVNAAVQEGAPVYIDGNPQKGLDYDATAEVGRKLLSSKAEVAHMMQDLEMKSKAAGTAMTQDQLVNQQYGALRPHIDNILEASAPGLLSNVSKTLQNIGPNVSPQQRNEVFAQIGMAETQATINARQYMRQFNVAPATEEAILKHIHNQYADYHTLATGDLSTNGGLQRSLNQMVDNNKVRFHEVAPKAAAMVDAVGPQAASGVFGNIADLSPGFTPEARGYIDNSPHPADVIGKAADTANGQFDPSKEQNPQHAAAVNRALVTTINSYTSRPNSLTPKEQSAFGNSVIGVGRSALTLSDRQQIQYASHTLNSPGFLQTFDAYAKNPNNADHVPVVAGYVRDVNMANIEKASQFVRNGGDLKLPGNTTGPAPTTAFGARARSGVPSITVHYSSAYDPAKGQVEFNASATDANGKRVILTAEQVRSVMSQTQDFRSSVSELNRSLGTVAHMAQYPGGMGGDTKSEMEFHVQNNGLPFKAGTKPSTFQTDTKPETGTKPEAGRQLAAYSEKIPTLFPGAKVTDTVRTPEENAKDNGAKNSMHLRGEALDFDAPGMTKDQVRAVLISHGLPITELLDAKDEAAMGKGHMGPNTFHWGWGEKKVAAR